MQKRKTAFTALIGCIFLFSLAVVLVLNLRVIYYLDISVLNLPELTGYTKETIRTNYDILIDYNLIGKGIEILELPDFPMSEQGRIHFEEVKTIFIVIQYVCVITGLLYVICLAEQIQKKQYAGLKMTAILTGVIPVCLGILAAVCWEKLFVLFHKICFRNDYWLFDPVTDPVINILPDAFFFHCAIAIVCLILAGSLFCWIFYWYLQHRKSLAVQKMNADEKEK